MGDVSKLRFTAWDMITVDEYFEASDTEYHVRYNVLEKLDPQGFIS
jgi:hypothetical protein